VFPGTGTTKERDMHVKLILLFVTAAVLTGLAGCYESPKMKVYQPGVYKGDKDPLLDKQRTPEQQATLRERFDRVQRDR
jgi:hypothetical protein